MKKLGLIKKRKISLWSTVLVALVLFIVFIILYFLQANVFSSLTIAGIKPNLFVIFILVIGLFGNNFLAMLFGIICGLWLDFLYSDVIGISSAMFCLIGFIATWFDSLWSKDEKISIVIMVVISTLIYEFGCYFINSIVLDFDLEMGAFFKILAIEELYNVLLTVIFFGMIKKLGYIMERKLKRSNMYTVEL